jgi:murein L,D-transpeptidase YcbB/YkuD
MPIRINLMAEAQFAEEMRRRDPVKRAIWLCGFAVILVVLWIAKVQMDITFENSKFRGIEAQWLSRKDQNDALTNSLAKVGVITRKLAALQNLSTNRFLWGNVLNALQQTVIDHVQVQHVVGSQTLVQEDAQTTGKGADKKTIPAAAVEKVTLSIDAKDLNPNAQNYAQYENKLSNFDFFLKRLQRRDGFEMDGVLGPLTSDPMDTNVVFKSFSLLSHFPDTRHIEVQ